MLTCNATLNVCEVKLIFILFWGYLLFLKWASSSKLKILLHIEEIHISNKKILHLLDLGDICLIKFYVSGRQFLPGSVLNSRSESFCEFQLNNPSEFKFKLRRRSAWDSFILEPKINSAVAESNSKPLWSSH